jgi:hypothetical protein
LKMWILSLSIKKDNKNHEFLSYLPF